MIEFIIVGFGFIDAVLGYFLASFPMSVEQTYNPSIRIKLNKAVILAFFSNLSMRIKTWQYALTIHKL
jgi:hypothetical protein